MTDAGKCRFTVSLEPEMFERLKIRAEQAHRSMSGQAVFYIEAGLETVVPGAGGIVHHRHLHEDDGTVEGCPGCFPPGTGQPDSEGRSGYRPGEQPSNRIRQPGRKEKPAEAGGASS